MALAQETHTETLTAEEARLAAEEFIFDHMDDQITSRPAWLVHLRLGAEWVVPLVLTVSAYNIIGAIGTLVVDGRIGHIVAYSPVEIIRGTAEQVLESQLLMEKR